MFCIQPSDTHHLWKSKCTQCSQNLCTTRQKFCFQGLGENRINLLCNLSIYIVGLYPRPLSSVVPTSPLLSCTHVPSPQLYPRPLSSVVPTSPLLICTHVPSPQLYPRPLSSFVPTSPLLICTHVPSPHLYPRPLSSFVPTSPLLICTHVPSPHFVVGVYWNVCA